jgi:hypothetical protein
MRKSLKPASRRLFLPFLPAVILLAAGPARGEFTSLNLGMDYRLRGVSVDNNDLDNATNDRFSYYSQNVRAYLTSWLNQDVEASLRLQSLNIWGLEGSASAPVTRYPKSDGTPFVEEAYIHLPHALWKRVDLVLGRQEIVLGDGLLVSDDDLGFNAIRARAELPWDADADAFTAKITEALGANDDFDLYGAVLGLTREHNRWELAWVQERNNAPSPYILGASTATSTKVLRRFYDLRLFGNLKDAYYKAEVALQSGEAKLLSGQEVSIKGSGHKLELGAETDDFKWGRFGVRGVYADGSGDDEGTPGTDEAFRPTFSRRYDGFQRVGYGSHFAATLSDAYDRSAPFAAALPATGLPLGVSGIRTMGLGIFSTQGVLWTGSLDYYAYTSRTKLAGKNDLGAELDAEVVYRYTGFVTFRLGMAYFFPGEVFGALASRAARYTAEAHVHF